MYFAQFTALIHAATLASDLRLGTTTKNVRTASPTYFRI